MIIYVVGIYCHVLQNLFIHFTTDVFVDIGHHKIKGLEHHKFFFSIIQVWNLAWLYSNKQLLYSVNAY